MEVRVLSSALSVKLGHFKNLRPVPANPTVHRHAKYLPLLRDFMPFFMPFSPEESPFSRWPTFRFLFNGSG